MSGSRRRWLIIAGLAVVAAAGVLLFFLLRPNTLLDTGPLDLPGVPDPPEEGEEVLLAVGDLAHCPHQADDRLAELAAQLPGTIALLGDNVYPEATTDTIRDCLAPSWGPLRDRLRPILGNHDYVNGSADASFEFYGDAAAGPSGQGWYSYDLGEWHMVALNSNCELVGGCGPDSPQVEWLRQDLAAFEDAGGDCLLAYWHHPLLSSGRHGGVEQVRPLWDAVVDAGVDVTLHGHDHTYERLTVDGVESFVVGTGGRSLYQWERDPLPQTSARHDKNYGLLYLVLGEGEFSWDFLPLGATTFTDAGTGDC